MPLFVSDGNLAQMNLGQLGDFVASSGVELDFVDAGVPLTDYGSEGSGPGSAWRRQPSVRKVVSYIARNVASVPLQAFHRLSDTDRRRAHDDPVSATLLRPSRVKTVTPYRFWESVLTDGLLWDRWAVLKVTDPEDRRTYLQRIPARRFRVVADGMDQPTGIKVWRSDGTWTPIGLDRVILDVGYATAGAGGTSPIDTIRTILDEAAEAVGYRRQVWRNGARVPGFILRDKPWPDGPARERFAAGLAAYTRDGGRSGGLPVLNDGMKFQEAKVFSPQEATDLEGRRLTDQEVASFYHIAPELVGAREGTYSNLDAFRQMLWGASLGPYIEAWEQAVDLCLDDVKASPDVYVEANLEAKLRGSFQEQASIMQSATGAPWLTRNEARAKQNLSAIDGGDELVVPLNVLVGGQASPNDSAPPPADGVPPPKARRVIVGAKSRPERHVSRDEGVLEAFFGRQYASVLARLGADPGGEWWDKDRWNRELADDLNRLGLSTATSAGKASVMQLGFAAGIYDEDRTLAWIAESCRRIAVDQNANTRSVLAAGLKDPDATDPVAGARTAWKDHGPSASRLSESLVTLMSAFGTVEAARQVMPGAVKVWRAHSNSRPEHARMNGETRELDEVFSNGLRFPGQGTNADEVAGCRCSVDITQP